MDGKKKSILHSAFRLYLFYKYLRPTEDLGRIVSYIIHNIERYVKKFVNGKKVSPESERYEEYLFGYSRIIHTDICTFTLVFSHGNKSSAGQGAP